MKKFLAFSLMLLLITSMLLVGCGGNQEEVKPESKPEKQAEAPDTSKADEKKEETVETNPAKLRANAKDTLIVGTPDIKGEGLPVYYSTSYDSNVVEMIFDGLITINKAGEFVPHIATEYEMSEDKLTYTFKLRDNIKFTNGESLTTEDVKFTYEIIADPSYDGRYAPYVEFIEGAKEYTDGKAKDVSGIKIIDNTTISFTFTEPRFDNISNLGMGIMPKSVYAYDFNNTQALREKMNNYEWIGTGAYKLVHFEPTQYTELIRNDDYFLGKPKMEKVIFKTTTVDTQMAEIEKGDIDILINVSPSPENFGVLDRLDYALPHLFPGNRYGYMGFNMRDDVLKDKRVRQALIYGFNREVFVNKYYDGHASVLNVPFSLVSYALTDSLKSKINDYAYDKEKANNLLEEAGWIVGSDDYRYKDGKKLEFKWLTYTDSKYVQTLTPMLIQFWKEIGVNLQVEQMEFNTLVDKVYVQRDFDMYNMAWALDNLPTGNYTIFHSNVDVPDGNNSVGYRNERSDELLNVASKEFDIEKQIKQLEEWAILFNDEVPYMLIDVTEELEVVNSRVKNYNTSSFVDIGAILRDVTVE